jgi:hypothetical protein
VFYVTGPVPGIKVPISSYTFYNIEKNAYKLYKNCCNFILFFVVQIVIKVTCNFTIRMAPEAPYATKTFKAAFNYSTVMGTWGCAAKLFTAVIKTVVQRAVANFIKLFSA